MDCKAAKPSGRYVWVAYQTHKPHLPIAVADSATELAEMFGVASSTVFASNSKLRHGNRKHAKYVCVYVGEGED